MVVTIWFTYFPVGGFHLAQAPFIFKSWQETNTFYWAIITFLGLSATLAIYLIIMAYQICKPSYSAIYEYTYLLSVGFFGWLIWGSLPSFLSLLGIIAIIVQGGLIGPLVKKLGEMRLTLIGSGFILVACCFLITAPKENAAINIYSAVSFLAVGAGLITPTLRALISKKLDTDKQGSILSSLQGLQSLGGVLGIAMAGRGYDSFGPKSPFIAGSVILLFMIYLIAEGKNNNSFSDQISKVS